MSNTNWHTFKPEETSLGTFHSYMLSAVGPRPIAFVSTIDAHGRPNLAPFSFFNAFGTNPATLVFSPARRGKDNSTKHTLHNVEAIPECVINVVTYPIVEQVSLASTDFDEGISEFVKAGFTPLASEMVRPFRVAESPAAFECKVEQVIKTGDQGGAGNLVVCRILCVHFHDSVVQPDGKIDQIKMDLVGRMGYEYYCHANAQSIFEVPKPRTKDVLGFDGLPDHIRESELLSGKELARLANGKKTFSDAEINLFLKQHPEKNFQQLFELGKQLLEKTQSEEAMLHLQSAFLMKNN